MSLIHDALKKAGEKESPPVGSGLASFQEPPAPPHRRFPTRIIVLAVVLIAAIAIFVYLQMSSRKPPPSALPQPKQGEAATDLTNMDVSQLKRRAMEAYRADDLAAAWSILSTASRLDAKDPEIWNNMGLVARQRGDTAGARQAYEKALMLKKDYPESLNNLAVLEMREGNVAQARKDLEQALQLEPANPEANFHMGLLYDQQDNKQKAVQYYKSFLEVSGDFPSNIVDAVRDRIVEIEP